MHDLRGKKYLLKTISLAVVIVFSVQQITWASGNLAEVSSRAGVGKTAVSNTGLGEIRVSGKSADIESSYDGPEENETIITIQDCHSSLSAQYSIVNILNDLLANYDLDLVAVEGGCGFIDTSVLKSFPDNDIRSETASFLMKEGMISAGEFFSVTSEKDIALYGAEDNELYRKNLRAFRDIFSRNTGNIKFLDRVIETLGDIEKTIYGPRLRKLLYRMRLHAEGKIPFKVYWGFLEKMCREEGISRENMPNIRRFFESAELEKNIDFTLANRQRKELINEFMGSASRADMEKIVKMSLSYEKGMVSHAEFHSWLMVAAEEKGLDLSDYKEVKAYARYVVNYSELDIVALDRELKAAEKSILSGLITTKEHERIFNMTNMARRLRALFSIQLNTDEVNFLKRAMEDITAGEFEAALAEAGMDLAAGELEGIFSEAVKALEFYDIAEARNHSMIRNTVKAMRREGKKAAALISGGHHSEGLSRIMKEKGLSYLILMPRFNDDRERPYVAVLTKKEGPYRELVKTGAYDLALEAYFDTGNIQELGRMVAYAVGQSALNGVDLAEKIEEWLVSYEERYSGLSGKRAEAMEAEAIRPEDLARYLGTIKIDVSEEQRQCFVTINNTRFNVTREGAEIVAAGKPLLTEKSLLPAGKALALIRRIFGKDGRTIAGIVMKRSLAGKTGPGALDVIRKGINADPSAASISIIIPLLIFWASVSGLEEDEKESEKSEIMRLLNETGIKYTIEDLLQLEYPFFRRMTRKFVRRVRSIGLDGKFVSALYNSAKLIKAVEYIADIAAGKKFSRDNAELNIISSFVDRGIKRHEREQKRAEFQRHPRDIMSMGRSERLWIGENYTERYEEMDYAVRHMERVAEIAVLIGERMGLRSDLLRILSAAAQTHDGEYIDPDAFDRIIEYNGGLFHGGKRLNAEDRKEHRNLYDFLRYLRERKGDDLTQEEDYIARDLYDHGGRAVDDIQGMKIEMPAEVELLIRYHQHPSNFFENQDEILRNKELLNATPGELRKLFAVLLAADIFETGNNRDKMVLLRDGREPETFDETFEFLVKAFGNEGITDTSALDALAELISERDASLFSLVRDARDPREEDSEELALREGDESFIEVFLSRKRSSDDDPRVFWSKWFKYPFMLLFLSLAFIGKAAEAPDLANIDEKAPYGERLERAARLTSFSVDAIYSDREEESRRDAFIALLAIADHESGGFRWRRSLGGGTDSGITQVTSQDALNTIEYITERRPLTMGDELALAFAEVFNRVHGSDLNYRHLGLYPAAQWSRQLIESDALSFAMAGARMRWDPRPIPKRGDYPDVDSYSEAVAEYWVDVYNRATDERKRAALQNRMCENTRDLLRYLEDEGYGPLAQGAAWRVGDLYPETGELPDDEPIDVDFEVLPSAGPDYRKAYSVPKSLAEGPLSSAGKRLFLAIMALALSLIPAKAMRSSSSSRVIRDINETIKYEPGIFTPGSARKITVTASAVTLASSIIAVISPVIFSNVLSVTLFTVVFCCIAAFAGVTAGRFFEVWRRTLKKLRKSGKTDEESYATRISKDPVFKELPYADRRLVKVFEEHYLGYIFSLPGIAVLFTGARDFLSGGPGGLKVKDGEEVTEKKGREDERRQEHYFQAERSIRWGRVSFSASLILFTASTLMCLAAWKGASIPYGIGGLLLSAAAAYALAASKRYSDLGEEVYRAFRKLQYSEEDARRKPVAKRTGKGDIVLERKVFDRLPYEMQKIIVLHEAVLPDLWSMLLILPGLERFISLIIGKRDMAELWLQVFGQKSFDSLDLYLDGIAEEAGFYVASDNWEVENMKGLLKQWNRWNKRARAMGLTKRERRSGDRPYPSSYKEINGWNFTADMGALYPFHIEARSKDDVDQAVSSRLYYREVLEMMSHLSPDKKIVWKNEMSAHSGKGLYLDIYSSGAGVQEGMTRRFGIPYLPLERSPMDPVCVSRRGEPVIYSVRGYPDAERPLQIIAVKGTKGMTNLMASRCYDVERIIRSSGFTLDKVFTQNEEGQILVYFIPRRTGYVKFFDSDPEPRVVDPLSVCGLWTLYGEEEFSQFSRENVRKALSRTALLQNGEQAFQVIAEIKRNFYEAEGVGLLPPAVYYKLESVFFREDELKRGEVQNLVGSQKDVIDRLWEKGARRINFVLNLSQEGLSDVLNWVILRRILEYANSRGFTTVLFMKDMVENIDIVEEKWGIIDKKVLPLVDKISFNVQEPNDELVKVLERIRQSCRDKNIEIFTFVNRENFAPEESEENCAVSALADIFARGIGDLKGFEWEITRDPEKGPGAVREKDYEGLVNFLHKKYLTMNIDFALFGRESTSLYIGSSGQISMSGRDGEEFFANIFDDRSLSDHDSRSRFKSITDNIRRQSSFIPRESHSLLFSIEKLINRNIDRASGDKGPLDTVIIHKKEEFIRIMGEELGRSRFSSKEKSMIDDIFRHMSENELVNKYGKLYSDFRDRITEIAGMETYSVEQAVQSLRNHYKNPDASHRVNIKEQIAVSVARRLSVPEEDVDLLRLAMWGYDLGNPLRQGGASAEIRSLLLSRYPEEDYVERAVSRFIADNGGYDKTRREQKLILIKGLEALKGSELNEEESRMAERMFDPNFYSLQAIREKGVVIPSRAEQLIEFYGRFEDFAARKEELGSREKPEEAMRGLEELIAVAKVVDIFLYGNEFYTQGRKGKGIEPFPHTIEFLLRDIEKIDADKRSLKKTVKALLELMRDRDATLMDSVAKARGKQEAFLTDEDEAFIDFLEKRYPSEIDNISGIMEEFYSSGKAVTADLYRRWSYMCFCLGAACLMFLPFLQTLGPLVPPALALSIYFIWKAIIFGEITEEIANAMTFALDEEIRRISEALLEWSFPDYDGDAKWHTPEKIMEAFKSLVNEERRKEYDKYIIGGEEGDYDFNLKRAIESKMVKLLAFYKSDIFAENEELNFMQKRIIDVLLEKAEYSSSGTSREEDLRSALGLDLLYRDIMKLPIARLMPKGFLGFEEFSAAYRLLSVETRRWVDLVETFGVRFFVIHNMIYQRIPGLSLLIMNRKLRSLNEEAGPITDYENLHIDPDRGRMMRRNEEGVLSWEDGDGLAVMLAPDKASLDVIRQVQESIKESLSENPGAVRFYPEEHVLVELSRIFRNTLGPSIDQDRQLRREFKKNSVIGIVRRVMRYGNYPLSFDFDLRNLTVTEEGDIVIM
ncbi:MAG: hypothetical protein GF408_06565, partial [Candidatus Omnitrophica bacterium]|nr:hypothetical protein [Candidatus Omnitrophota bacterium]